MITGAASGIGRALALDCADRGAKLALADLDATCLKATADDARRRGAEVVETTLDVANRASIYRWATDIEKWSGGADVLINNAGVSLSHSIENMRDEDFEWLFNINFWGVVNGCKAFLPQLRRRPEAHIVNLSSVFGLIAVPTQAAYNASKFAVRGYTEALRQELHGTEVHVTCVHPGGIKTNIVRRGRHYQDASGANTNVERSAANFDRAARTSPEAAARAIVHAILKNQRRLLIGADARIIDVLARLMPASYDPIVAFVARLGSRAGQ